MKTSANLFRTLLLASLVANPLTYAAESTPATSSVKLSDANKPGTLRVEMPWADISVEATDGDTVSVTSTLTNKNQKVDRPGGLRRLDNQTSFELVEKDNVVSIALVGDSRMVSHDAEFKILVPRSMALNLKTNVGGDVRVKNVEGDIEVNNLNGEVKLEGISGSAVVNTMNGEVDITYATVPTKPIAITSMNGEVDLRIPSDTKANVRIRSHNGSILTDFDEDVLKTKTEGKSGSQHSYSYSYGNSEEARRVAREATQTAKAAVHEAMQIAKEVADEVQRSIAEADAEAAAADAEAPKAPKSPKSPRAPRAPMPPITGGKLVSGTLNGGGIDINISTMNGEITLRQKK
ncbi:DUF4097 family beta strand repeat-containing protein [Oleiharenicola lentus]|uniref:DUF4097 family beta strand repeat-containing protein n=1 Tax=Oleiharenicola lentus TaxID=2508720 RepID=UPI003F6627E6